MLASKCMVPCTSTTSGVINLQWLDTLRGRQCLNVVGSMAAGLEPAAEMMAAVDMQPCGNMSSRLATSEWCILPHDHCMHTPQASLMPAGDDSAHHVLSHGSTHSTKVASCWCWWHIVCRCVSWLLLLHERSLCGNAHCTSAPQLTAASRHTLRW
jgi:hypothetical protein